MLPTAVGHILTNLRSMLEQGQTESVKRTVSRLLTHIEVQEVPVEGRRRPKAVLEYKGGLAEVLRAADAKIKTVNSPGGILPLLMSDTFEGRIELTGRAPG